MSDIMDRDAPSSIEFSLDKHIEEMVATMAQRDLTPAEEEQFIGLLTQRSSLMKPASNRRFPLFGRSKLRFAA